MSDARVFQEQVEVGVNAQTSEARVSQEEVQVAISPISEARVAQQHIEVAYYVIEPEPGDRKIRIAGVFVPKPMLPKVGGSF